MPVYSVEVPSTILTKKGGASTMIASGENAGEALAAVQALYGDHGGKASWANATVTALQGKVDTDPNSLVGWTITITINTDPITQVSLTGDATYHSIPQWYPELAIRMNATPLISNAGWGFGYVTLAEGATDGLGDKLVTVSLVPPIIENQGGQQNELIHQSSLINGVIDGGDPGDDLTLQMGFNEVPQIFVGGRNRSGSF